MLRHLFVLAGLALGIIAAPAHAALSVFACEPEWAALTQELGGGDVSVFSATTAQQDPHKIQARPSLIARIRGADLLVCTGAELEVGWLPLLLRQGANPKVSPGQRGHFVATEYVQMREVPVRLDRADGDLHASGNPHIQTNPANIRAVAVALAQRLADLDPARASAHAERAQRFLARWDAATTRWQAQAAPLSGVAIAAHHREWGYLCAWLGMREAIALEPKPGIPPSANHLATVVGEIPRQQVRVIVHAAYQDPRAAQFVAERTGLPTVMLPFTVGGTPRATDLFGLFDDTIDRLLGALKGSVGKS